MTWWAEKNDIESMIIAFVMDMYVEIAAVQARFF
jgi:hypothetical protein